MCTANAATALQAGGVIQGVAGFAKAQAEAGSLEFNARAAENEARFADIQAEQTQQAGAVQATQLRQAASQQVAANVAATAGSGIDIGGATAQEVIESTARVGVADIIQSQLNTKRAVWKFGTEAAISRAEAKQLKKAAKRTRLLAPITFAAPVITGFGQAKLATKQGAS